MRIAIGYVGSEYEQVMQNRQYQAFSLASQIYPVIPAYAATELYNLDHEVDFGDFYNPSQEYDLIALEAKTPNIKKTWAWINRYKLWSPSTTIVVMGDHVSALPDETLQNSKADYVIKGGDYDASLKYIVQENPQEKIIEREQDLSLSPIINRKLTNWRAYSRNNGNFKYTPATYTQFGRDCWWRKDGGCTFCSWANLHRNYRTLPLSRAMEEVINCHSLGIKEIFDDSGSFPVGQWLHDFSDSLRKFNGGLKHGIKFGCNMRVGTLDRFEYEAMAQAGFRLILFGMESANQNTLDRLNKGIQASDILDSCRMAKLAGLEPHVTVMVGYPWETREDIRNTVSLAKLLFSKGYIESLQATLVIPYPNTKMFKEAKRNGWLITENWDDYGMSRPVMRSRVSEHDLKKAIRDLYGSCTNWHFIKHKLTSIRNFEDFKTLLRQTAKWIGHIHDFNDRG